MTKDEVRLRLNLTKKSTPVIERVFNIVKDVPRECVNITSTSDFHYGSRKNRPKDSEFYRVGASANRSAQYQFYTWLEIKKNCRKNNEQI